MKWFVTDAQLAAMDAAIWAKYKQAYEQWLNEGHGARADREQERAPAPDPHGPFIAHLRDEVAYWRLQFQHERQRAEVAIDQCRATHQGIGAVSLPLRDDRPPSAFPQSEEQALASLNLDGM